MADVKWIKIVTDIFDDEKMLLLDCLPEHDAIVVIWFKLLCLAGKQNNSGVFIMNNRIPYTDEMLATIFRRPINTVRLALESFRTYGMIEIIDNVITIPNWEKHQSLDSIEKRREYLKNYMAEKRQKQKALAENVNTNEMLTGVNKVLTVNGADIDKERERDKEEDIDNTPLPPTGDSCKKTDTYSSQISEIVAFLNETVGAKYKNDTPKTRELITARIKQGFTVDNFKTVINKKYTEWKGTDFAKFLRPETLFGNKFEGYLNEKGKEETKKESSFDTDEFFNAALKRSAERTKIN